MAYKRGTVKIDVDDIVGKRFGMLLVMQYWGNWYEITAGGERFRHFYRCKCKCGNIVVVRRHSLLNDNTKSCGCLKGVRHRYGN